MAIKEEQGKELQLQIDSIKNQQVLSNQVFAEIKAQFPGVRNAIIQPSAILSDSTTQNTMLILLSMSGNIPSREKARLKNWLQVRLNQPNINLIFQ
ncbi:MAG: hypothetical protein IPJ81_05875 [Chitinophagaceae bacterium]|nr:hypothetical protein [Chitinophagaceae bacterium]